MMTESILDRIELTAVARPGAIVLSVKVDSSGCTDLRRIHNLFSNHGHPAWPQTIEVIYGWRGLSKDIHLKSTSNKGLAEYSITNDILYEMNLLDPPFYVKDVVNVRVAFSSDVIIHSMPFRIGHSSSNGDSMNKDGISHDTLLLHDEHSQVSFANDGSSGGGGGGDTSSVSSWGHTMARAWANDGSQHGAESEMDEEGWEESGGGTGRRCVCCLICCTPCYRSCHCLWHVARSTPATSLLSLGLAIAVICIYNFYVPVVKSELKNAGLVIEDQLFNLLRLCSVIILVLDGVYVLISALLMGTTREIICASLYSGELQYSPTQKWKCKVVARCIRNFGGLFLIKLLVISSFATIAAAGFLLFSTTIGWYSSSLASLSCTYYKGDDDFQNNSDTEQLFKLFDRALVWTDFTRFDFQAFCIDHSSYVPAVHLRREESVYQHMLILLLANGALVIGQAMFFTLMVDNHRVATIAAAEYQSGSISTNSTSTSQHRPLSDGERPLISEASEQ